MVSFKTANALKSAGFHQPEKQYGQFWYDSQGNTWVIGRVGINQDSPLIARMMNNTRWEWLRDTEGFMFAPTATEILPYLNQPLNHSDTWFFFTGSEKKYTNACEACAKRYLDLF